MLTLVNIKSTELNILFKSRCVFNIGSNYLHISLSVSLPLGPSVCLFVWLSVSLSSWPSLCLFICLSVSLSLCFSVPLSFCLSVFRSASLSIFKKVWQMLANEWSLHSLKFFYFLPCDIYIFVENQLWALIFFGGRPSCSKIIELSLLNILNPMIAIAMD